jgi:hypothetical protein
MGINVDQLIGWLDKADKIARTPLLRMTIIPLLADLIPKDELTPEQLEQVRTHFTDLDARLERAKERAKRPVQ